MRIEFDSYIIQPLKTADAWSLCDFMVSNEYRFKRYLPQTLKQNLTPDLSKIFVEKKIRQFQFEKEFLFTLKEVNSKNIIGLIYLKDIDWENKFGEFAYCISYQFESKGLISKCVALLSNYAFENFKLETLQIIVHKTNIASLKVAKNCSFTWVKTLYNEHAPPGEPPMDMELYELQKKPI